METLGSMKAGVQRWCRETLDDDLLTDAVNDAIEKLWLSIVTVNLSSFVGGPVQNVTFAAASERQTIVSLADPTTPPSFSVSSEGALPMRSLIGGYTLVTESGSQTLLSTTAAVSVPANNLVSMVSPAYVSGAFGWYPYFGSTNGRLSLQSDAPIPFGTNWTEPATGVQDLPENPSPPTSNLTADDIFYIKVLEVQNPDGTYTRWQGAALEDLIMERAEQTVATSNSTYQPYFYDLVNGNRIEARPALGTTLSPRYFYTQKPRRLSFDNSPLPFTQYAGSVECVRDYGIAAVQLALKEPEMALAWESKGQQIEQKILAAANLQNRARVTRVTPYMR